MIRVREMDIDAYRQYATALESARGPAWRYDETKPCGISCNNFLLARVYDTYHRMFRDYRQEAEQILATLALHAESTVIDMGCGTGAFALHAAERCRRIWAVDVSRAMLNRVRHKARRARVKNIEFRCGGFLTYEHKDDPVDAVVSVAALHHLPDFWKLVALHRLAAMVKPSGRLYLFDVVLSFPAGDYEEAIERFVRTMSVQMGPNGRAESETHFREEYSTCDWILTSLLERAGFEVDRTERTNEFLASYLCTKRMQRP
jgi:cyclopropane fatty-acyl-phospholipid synthase-like methyltransferase